MHKYAGIPSIQSWQGGQIYFLLSYGLFQIAEWSEKLHLQSPNEMMELR
jgi:hypothetical protein